MKRVTALFCLCVVLSVNSYGQTGFQKGRTWIGPTIGYGFGGIGFGAGVEYGITPNIGFGLEGAYSSFTQDQIGIKIDYTIITALAAASYHFSPGEQFDPFVKAGIGYINVDQKFQDSALNAFFQPAYASGIGITGQIGARYSITPNIDLRAAIGYPFLASVGVDYAFGGSKSTRQKDADATTTTEQGSTTSATTASDKYSIFIGPYIAGKGSIPIAVAESRLMAPGFNPDFGVTALFPFGKGSSMGVGVDLGYTGYTYTTKPLISNDTTDAINTIKEKYNYITFAPYLNLGGFTLGLNFGFPSSATFTDDNDSTVSMVRDTNTIFPKEIDATQYLKTLMEVRVGGMIPVFSNDMGRLNINLQAGYVFSGLYTDHKNYVGAYEGTSLDPNNNKKPKEELNPTPVTLSLGLSYLFNLGF
ncbi:MAG: outer membrane beta-barrel protein [Bacteroidota bacterium]